MTHPIAAAAFSDNLFRHPDETIDLNALLSPGIDKDSDALATIADQLAKMIRVHEITFVDDDSGFLARGMTMALRRIASSVKDMEMERQLTLMVIQQRAGLHVLNNPVDGDDQ